MFLSAILLLAAAATATPAPACRVPISCEEARAMLSQDFKGDRAAAMRWAQKCGMSRLDVLKGRVLCGL